MAQKPLAAFSPGRQVGYVDRPLRVIPPAGIPDANIMQAGHREHMTSAPTMPGATSTQSPPYPHGDRPMDKLDLSKLPTAPKNLPPMPAPPINPMPTGSASRVAPGGDTPRSLSVVENQGNTPVAGSEESEDKYTSPAVRMVNNNRILLNYQIKDVGPSGVSAVELWYTKDGRHWQKDENAVRTGPPYVAEVKDEGMYGFTLIARNGLGLGQKPPQTGDLPQVWVEVDLTKPTVAVKDVKQGLGASARELTINWSASDRNLARRPITISYAENEDGPWIPLSANTENSGKFVWQIPANGPTKFMIRVEALDLVGNVGAAQTSKPIVIDTSKPTVSILEVEPASR